MKNLRHHVFCCVNERPEGSRRPCCQRQGGKDLRNYMKNRAKSLGLEGVRINAAGCLDRCEDGPTMVVYPAGIWYRPRTQADVDAILTEHLQDGVPVERLRIKDDE